MEDTYDPRLASEQSAPASPPNGNGADHGWDGAERRYFARRPCRIEAEVRLQGETSGLSARITDISVSGCYLEMLIPLPAESNIEVLFKPGEAPVKARAKVRTSQMGLGMGVSFMDMSPEDFQELLRFAPPARYESSPIEQSHATAATAYGGAAHPAESNGEGRVLLLDAPQEKETSEATTAEELEAVVLILMRKGLLGRSEIRDEITRLKAAKASSPASNYSNSFQGAANRRK